MAPWGGEDEDGRPANVTLRVVGPGPTLNCNLGGTGGPYMPVR